jgi:hypothetical protein
MSKKITSFYDDELNIKKVSLLFYLDEINKLEELEELEDLPDITNDFEYI